MYNLEDVICELPKVGIYPLAIMDTIDTCKKVLELSPSPDTDLCLFWSNYDKLPFETDVVSMISVPNEDINITNRIIDNLYAALEDVLRSYNSTADYRRYINGEDSHLYVNDVEVFELDEDFFITPNNDDDYRDERDDYYDAIARSVGAVDRIW